MKKLTVYLIIILFAISLSKAQQIPFEQNIIVTQNNKTLKWPFTGGHNSSTLHQIDLNLDGIKDLVIFDKLGNTVTTFLNAGIADSVSYNYAPQYEAKFSKMIGWIELIDYNCDGKEDIFTYINASATVQVWKNISTPSNLEFTMTFEGLTANYLNSSPERIFVNKTDISDFKDIDSDGDIDIIIFDNVYSSGNQVTFYRNLRVELNLPCDTMVFEEYQRGWGMFIETSNSNNILLNTCLGSSFNCKLKTGSTKTKNAMDGGGSLELIKTNCDSTYDILIGDQFYTNLILGKNNGSKLKANIYEVDTVFPKNDVPVRMPIFPAASSVDVNNDGKLDLFISPNTIVAAAKDTKAILYYKNIGTTCQNNFKLEQEDFIGDNTIDVGSLAKPLFIDYDADGKTDLLVSNKSCYKEKNVSNNLYVGSTISRIAFFKNIGNNNTPLFNLITEDLDSLSKLNRLSLHPAYGDLDNDGDLDLILGQSNGQFIRYNNIAGAGNTPNFALVNSVLKNSLGQNLSTYANSAPVLYDINNDGKLDIISGSQGSPIFYFQNVGTLTNPLFNLVSDSLGGIDYRSDTITSFAESQLFITKENNATVMYVANVFGKIFKYNNIDNNFLGKYNLVSSNYANINIKSNASISFAKFGTKNILAVGTALGGIKLFNDTLSIVNILTKIGKINNYNVYPNPTKDIVKITGKDYSKNIDIKLLDHTGKIMLAKIFEGNEINLSIENFTPGIYVLQIKSDNSIRHIKIIKQ